MNTFLKEKKPQKPVKIIKGNQIKFSFEMTNEGINQMNSEFFHNIFEFVCNENLVREVQSREKYEDEVMLKKWDDFLELGRQDRKIDVTEDVEISSSK